MDHRIGPYALGARLGEGGMARVYRATGPDGEDVALKLARTVHPVARRRFAREVRAVVGVEDPHVVPVLASGEQRGVPLRLGQQDVRAWLAEAHEDGPWQVGPLSTLVRPREWTAG